MEDGLHVVPVRVEDEGGVVVGVVALADAGRAVVAPAVGESGGVEPVDRLSIASDEGEVKRACRLSLDQRQVLGARWPKDNRRSPRRRRPGHVEGPGA